MNLMEIEELENLGAPNALVDFVEGVVVGAVIAAAPPLIVYGIIAVT